MTTVITTAGLSPADSVAFWQDGMTGSLGYRDIHALSDGPIRATAQRSWLGRMLLVRMMATAQEIQRTRHHVTRDGIEYVQVAVVGEGVGRLEQDGRQVELYPGDCVLYETSRPFTWSFAGDWDVSLFGFPSASVPLPQPRRPQLTARRLEGRAALTGVTSRFLLDMARNIDALPTELAEPMTVTARDLVLTLLADRLGATSAGGGPAQRTLMLRINDYIERQHRDAALGPTEIAAAANISTRYLHKLFEGEHETVALYLRRLRLQHARDELLDPRLAHRSVAAIAHGCGFGDISGFNRAFRHAYGMTPKGMRAAALADESEASHTAEPVRGWSSPTPLDLPR
jgi:AraC-like DNA-binding protein